jgi:hypothetical protein
MGGKVSEERKLPEFLRGRILVPRNCGGGGEKSEKPTFSTIPNNHNNKRHEIECCPLPTWLAGLRNDRARQQLKVGSLRARAVSVRHCQAVCRGLLRRHLGSGAQNRSFTINCKTSGGNEKMGPTKEIEADHGNIFGPT